MSSVTAINQSLGDARNIAFDHMKDLLTDESTDPGKKSALLLDAQAELGITDGVQNILSKGYNRWQQTGQ